jgi:hypothetical protein
LEGDEEWHAGVEHNFGVQAVGAAILDMVDIITEMLSISNPMHV